MGVVLCLNTAFAKADLALSVNNKNDYISIDSNAKSSENVLPCIEKMLSQKNLKPTDLDFIGVVVGPGSFTGLRIGVAIVKGFVCVKEKIKIVEINSLDLMAKTFLNKFKNKINQKNFYCVLNALSGRFFIAKYDCFGNCLEKAKLVNELPISSIFVGLEIESLDFVDFNIQVTPEILLDLCCENIKNENFIPLEDLKPLYLRLSQAEENLCS